MAKESVYPDFTKIFTQFKAPTVDASAFLAVGRRNMEVFTAANKMVAESAREITKRQVDVLQSNVEEALKATKELWSSENPSANAAKQAELTKYFVESTLSNARELAEMTSKSNSEVMDVLHKRFVESVEEVNSATKDVVAKAA